MFVIWSEFNNKEILTMLFKTRFTNSLNSFALIAFVSSIFSTGFCFSEELKVPDNKPIQAKPAVANAQIRYFDSIDATQLILGNGMTVCLKPTDSDTDEIFFKLVALGGYGSLSSKNFFSGEMADKIAWESGMGGMTSDQISVYLYENSLEFVLEISPFSRSIVGEGQEESIRSFLKGVRMVFTEQQFTEEGFKAAKLLTKDIIGKLSHDNEHVYEEAFRRINTQNFPALRPSQIENFEKVKFDVARDFFKRSFSDPSDFILVIAGNFDVPTVIQQVEKYLGAISKPAEGTRLKKTFSVPFPPGITETTIKLPNQTSCLTHVTFPLKIDVNDLNIDEIAFMCQIIEARLRQVITHKMDLSYGVDVSYEFPVYPFLNNPWVSIRFRCEEKFISQLKGIVLTEMARLQSQGVTQEEIEAIKKLEMGSREFWLKDDFYWVSMLSNYYLWGWNPEKIDAKNTSINKINAAGINALLKKAISLSNFSIVTATGTSAG